MYSNNTITIENLPPQLLQVSLQLSLISPGVSSSQGPLTHGASQTFEPKDIRSKNAQVTPSHIWL